MSNPSFPHTPSVPIALVIDLDALAHNYQILRTDLKKGTLCGAVVKANAYGMGIKEATTRLYHEGCRHFFVAYLSEAIEMKSYLGEDCFIYVLGGLREGDEEAYAHYNVIPVLGDLLQVRAWNTFAQRENKCLKAILHLDTGMTRTGLDSEAIKNLSLLDLSNIELMYVMSHLACAYQPDHPMNESQRQLFDNLRKRFHTIPASFASSGGLRLGPTYHYDLVRPGIALTGCRVANNPKLKPVLKAYAQVMQLNHIPAGTSVGYDATFIAQRPSRIATIAGGYADGYFRGLSNRGEVFFKGQILPLVGRVSMDSFTVDVTNVAIQTGDWVELFGENISAHAVASKVGSVSWELFARLSPRFERFYIGSRQTNG